MIYLFWCLAAFAFLGVFIGMKTRNGHQMAYAAVLGAIWSGLALWWSGAIG